MEPLELEESSPRVDFWDFLDFDFKKRFFFRQKIPIYLIWYKSTPLKLNIKGPILVNIRLYENTRTSGV